MASLPKRRFEAPSDIVEYFEKKVGDQWALRVVKKAFEIEKGDSEEVRYAKYCRHFERSEEHTS